MYGCDDEFYIHGAPRVLHYLSRCCKEQQMDAHIVIVGGGAAGLSAAGALKRRGLNSIVLDRNARIGDV